MDIYIQMDGQQRGPFSESTIIEGIKAGRFRPKDLATIHGTGSWQPLTALLAVIEAVKVQAQPTTPILESKTESSATQSITSETKRTERNTEPAHGLKNTQLDQRSEKLLPDERQSTIAESAEGKHTCRRCGSPYKVWSLFRGIGSGLCTDCTKATAKPRHWRVSNASLIVKIVIFTGLGPIFYKGCVATKFDRKYVDSNHAQNEKWKHSTPSHRPTDNVLKTGPDGRLVFSPMVPSQDAQRQFGTPPTSKSPIWDTPRTVTANVPKLRSVEADFKRAYGEPKEASHGRAPEDDVIVYDAERFILRVTFWNGVAHLIEVFRSDHQALTQGVIEERLDALADSEDWSQKRGADGTKANVWYGRDAFADVHQNTGDGSASDCLRIFTHEFLDEEHRLHEDK